MLKLSGLVIVDDCLSDLDAMSDFNDYFLNHPDLDATILPLGNGTGIGARKR
jgi:predicted O-methyltransferase YrrM